MTQQLDRQAGVSRRGLLGGIALGAGGLLVGAAAGHAAATQDAPEDSEPAPGSVPERPRFSWLPPWSSGSSPAPSRSHKAPTPLGPWILCADIAT